MKIFISYCHQDEEHVKRLLMHLSPLAKGGILDVWTDKRIKTGQNWREEIESAMLSADVVVLCASVGFFASKFVTDYELPTALERVRNREITILPIVVTPCRYKRSELSEFQAANDPDKALSVLSEPERDLILDELVQQIEAVLGSPELPSKSSGPSADSFLGAALTQIAAGPLLSADAVEKSQEHGVITDKKIYIPDLFRGRTPPVLEGKTFQRCVLIGPAVIGVVQCALSTCKLSFSDNSFLELAPGGVFGDWGFRQMQLPSLFL